MSDLAKLLADMRRCCLCDGLPLGPNPIFKLGPQVRMLIVGQAPGRITHAKNRPFDDPSGVRLREWLGVDCAAFYDDPRIGIYPMGLCFPGAGKGGDAPPRAECATTWRADVMARLPALELLVVIGRYAIDWHAPHLRRVSVTQAVQQSTDQMRILPHPSPRNNLWLRRNDWFERDHLPLLRARMAAILTT